MTGSYLVGTNTAASGNAGAILLTGDDIELSGSNGGNIDLSSSSLGTGQAGQIDLPLLALLGGSYSLGLGLHGLLLGGSCPSRRGRRCLLLGLGTLPLGHVHRPRLWETVSRPAAWTIWVAATC